MPTNSEFSDVRFDKSNSAERQQSNLGVSGEHGYDVHPLDQPPAVPAETYPNCFGYGPDASNTQFSSDKDGNPESMLEQTRVGVDAHSDMNASYGLYQPVATLGSHPWLRDGLTNTGEQEAGNAEPSPTIKLPKRG